MGFNLRAGPVGSVWGLAPGRVGALGKTPCDPPGPASREIILRGPVEAEGGCLGGERYVPNPVCPKREEGKD